jgi:hypothetical protein
MLVSACTPRPAHEENARGKRAARSQAHAEQRTIHPQPGNSDCIEMYGSCTPPPDQLCTSNAFVLACGERGELPSNGELIACVCP